MCANDIFAAEKVQMQNVLKCQCVDVLNIDLRLSALQVEVRMGRHES